VSLESVRPVVCAFPDAANAAAHIAAAPSIPPFDARIVDFVKRFSDEILRSRALRAYPETVAFGYWIRGARLQQMEQAFYALPTSGLLTPRGVAFHIAPANVDTIFLYSLVISLLAGNRNIVRISSRESEQVAIMCQLLQQLLGSPPCDVVSDRLLVVRYEHSEAVTREFSGLADVRVVWGGDTTVDAIRKIPLPPNGVEVNFADKVSFAVIDAAEYLAHGDSAKIAKSFFNDAYWFGQMACSSPRIVLWRGNDADVSKASAVFWPALEAQIASSPSSLSTMDFMNKFYAQQVFCAVSQAYVKRGANNLLNVIRVNSFNALSLDEHCGGGLFLEMSISTLAEISEFVTRKHQTVTTYGVRRDEWLGFIGTKRPRGIDRIVPVGEALNFAAVWDGFDLFRAFCREVSINC
jgi:hypothetical protein